MHTDTPKGAVEIRKLRIADYPALSSYLMGLSLETKQQFGPHGYRLEDIAMCYTDGTHKGYIAAHDEAIVGYFIVKLGYLSHDADRLRSYGIQLSDNTDATLAPSIADAWQGQKLGQDMFAFVRHDMLQQGRQRLLLWGGVQASNAHALSYYRALGFGKLGEFRHNGLNYDMALELGQ